MTEVSAEARHWIAGVLAAQGLVATGPAESVHDRPWSHVAKVPTSAGDYWFKENRGQTRYEPALLAALGRWAPGSVVIPLAVEPGHGWSLQPDGGATLRAAGTPVDWPDLLREYARLQVDLAQHAGQMIALGVPDLRPERLPVALAELLESDVVVSNLAPERLAELRAYQPEFEKLCATLAESPVPLSLQHDDLHDANVFHGAPYRFFDWGDAGVAHPFGVLLVTLRVIAHKGGLKPGDPMLAQVRDAYLEPWSALADQATLLRDVSLATQAAKVTRALSYARSLDGLPAALREPHDDGVYGWLEELLEP